MASHVIADPKEFFKLLEKDEKVELIDGEIVSMAGGLPRHSDVITGVTEAYLSATRSDECLWFPQDRAVRAGNSYLFPDLSIACHPVQEPEFPRALLNPFVIFEVLSPSTEGNDRGRKSVAYRSIPSLREYVLVSTTEPRVELHRRMEEGWLIVDFVGEGAVLPLLSLGLELPFRQIFARRIKDGWRE